MKQFDSSLLHDKLKEYFGFSSFKGNQEAVIRNVLEGKDTFVLMPTGGGKSLCYQLPAMLMDGVAIVISPLIALMKNQVDAMRTFSAESGIAHFLNSSLNKTAVAQVRQDVLDGKTKLLYFAPESLTKEDNVAFLRKIKVSFYAIDEAHCISEWGHDFRPEYRRIRPIINEIGSAPLIALTATATPKVQLDIQKNLGMSDASVFKSSFNRPNLYYEIRPKHNVDHDIIRFIKQNEGKSGIIYCLSRKKVEELTELLVANGIRALAYHAGMDASTRAANQDDFLMERVEVIVATIAFGMGIDKSNVRYVIHHNLPESIEAYYQEAGRAGRDGEPSRCTLLWNESDIVTRRRLLDNDYENERLTPEEQEIVRQSKRRLLDGMVGYCRTTDCLHRYMTRYFGQELSPNAGSTAGEDIAADSSQSGKCGACSNCESTFETIDVTRVAQAISRCVHDVGQRVGSGKIVKILRGSRAQDLAWLNPERMPTFGMLKDVNEARVRDVLSQMATDGYLSIAEGRMPIVMFGARAAETAAPDFHYEIKRVERKSAAAGSGRSGGVADTADSANVPGDALGSYIPDDDEESLFQKLRELRRTIAQEIGKPPYIVFSDKTLRDMARIKPVTNAQFLAVNGVGQHKLDLYGQRFMQAIASFNAGSAS